MINDFILNELIRRSKEHLSILERLLYLDLEFKDITHIKRMNNLLFIDIFDEYFYNLESKIN